MWKRIKQFFREKGPGLVTGAADDDPSGIGTYTFAGARFGLGQLWSVLFTLPLMIAVQELCARIALVTGKGLAGVLKIYYPRWILYICVCLLLIANTMNIGANIGAMAAATRLLIDIPFVILVLFFVMTTLLLEVFVSYKVYARYLKWLALSLFAYVITAFVVQPDWWEVVRHLTVPTIHFSKEFFIILVAIFGTTISPYLFFWQASQEVEDEISKGKKTIAQRKGATVHEMRIMRSDVKTGMIFSNVVAFFIMLTAASTLYPKGIVVETAQDAAQVLAPIAGPFASLLFTVGIIATGLLSIPVLAGSASYAFSETFGWKEGLYRKFRDAHGFYGVITLALLVGLMLNFIGLDPIKMLLWTAVLNGVIAPILLTFILLVGNNTKIMGKWRSGLWSNIGMTATILVMTGAIVVSFILW
ncbi:MAG: Nramp family divalent metal transporter [bacterium]|nr:Nramp family divalent metal transporter [bacterium]